MILRNVIGTVGVILSALVMCVSAVANARYGMTLARETFDVFVLTALAVFADVGKALSWVFLMNGVARREILVPLVSAFVFLACLSWAVAGSLGYMALGRSQTAGSKEDARVQAQSLDTEIRRKERTLTDLDQVEPVGVIEKKIEALRQDRRYSASAQCTNATLESTRSFCAQLARTEAELAKSKTFEKLEAEIAGLRSARALHGGEAHGAVGGDVQGALIAQIANLELSTVQAALSVISVVMLESGACFFLWLSLNYLHTARASPSGPAVLPSDDKARLGEDVAHVELRRSGSATDFVVFVSECVVLSARSEYGVLELINNYKAWCALRGKIPIPDADAELGVKAFCEAGGLRIRHRGRRAVVVGINVKLASG